MTAALAATLVRNVEPGKTCGGITLSTQSETSSIPNTRPSLGLCPPGRPVVQREPGPAARRRGGVLRAALDPAAADPDGDRALALRGPGRAAARPAPRARARGAGPGRRDRRRAGEIPAAPRRGRLGDAGDAAFLQHARLQGAGERALGDLHPSRAGALAAVLGFHASAFR